MVIYQSTTIKSEEQNELCFIIQIKGTYSRYSGFYRRSHKEHFNYFSRHGEYYIVYKD